MDIRLSIDQGLLIGKKKYWVIGIDNYILDNFLDEKKTWTSYTLESRLGENAWISKADDEHYFIRWHSIARSEFKMAATMILNLELSGTANISFIGARGYSTPMAETLYYNADSKEYDFLASERFLECVDNYLIPRESVYMIGKRLEIGSILIV